MALLFRCVCVVLVAAIMYVNCLVGVIGPTNDQVCLCVLHFSLSPCVFVSMDLPAYSESRIRFDRHVSGSFLVCNKCNVACNVIV